MAKFRPSRVSVVRVLWLGVLSSCCQTNHFCAFCTKTHPQQHRKVHATKDYETGCAGKCKQATGESCLAPR
uniref:Putative secreted protein n=1 Tax=Anopheles marajoara TaxID=58244 RepID=A0A2M4CEB0_9DIPT